MNQIATQNRFDAPSTAPASRMASMSADITERFKLAYDIASTLQYATLIPEHLRGTRKSNGGRWELVEFTPEQVRANVLMVVNRALQWNVDPVALLGESFVVGGKLDFQGKVIIAVVNKLAGLRTSLSFDYRGEGQDREVIVTGELLSEQGELRQVSLKFKDAVTFGKDGKVSEQWTKDVDQKLAYSGAKKWARRHAPEVVLGLFAEDDQESFEPSEPRTIDASAAPAEPQEPVEKPLIEQGRADRYYGYIEEVRGAESREALKEIMDRVDAEPSTKLAAHDADAIRSLARGRYKDMGTAQFDYKTALKHSTDEASLKRLRDKLIADSGVDQGLAEEAMGEINDRLAALESEK